MNFMFPDHLPRYEFHVSRPPGPLWISCFPTTSAVMNFMFPDHLARYEFHVSRPPAPVMKFMFPDHLARYEFHVFRPPGPLWLRRRSFWTAVLAFGFSFLYTSFDNLCEGFSLRTAPVACFQTIPGPLWNSRGPFPFVSYSRSTRIKHIYYAVALIGLF